MKKSLCLLTSLALSLCAGAQEVSTPGDGDDPCAHSSLAPQGSAPLLADLGERQRLLGYYTTDTLSKSGFGLPQYGDNGHCRAGIELTPEMLEPFVGKKIVGVRFGLCAKIDSSRVFVAQVSSGQVGGDEVTAAAAKPQKGWNTVLFDTPYAITPGAHLMVGFEYAQKTKKKGGYYSDVCYPLSVVKVGLKNKPLQLYYNGADGDGWYRVENTGKNLSIQVVVEGDFGDSSVRPFGFGTVAAGLDRDTTATVRVLNLGARPVSGLAYTVSIDGVVGEERQFVFDTPVPTSGVATFPAVLPAVESYGRKRVVVDVTKVDGADNQADVREAKGYVGAARDFFPRNVLIEEFTTEQCSNCPRVADYLHRALEAADPTRLFAVSHHSAFFTDWLTQPCDEDICSLMFGGSGDTFAPAMMMNRNGDILQDCPSVQGNVFLPTSQAEITYRANQLMAQPANSQLDVRVAPGEDGTQATVIVTGRCNEEFEVDMSRLTLYLAEDSIPAQEQQGADADFRHMHVIRYSNSSWGDLVAWRDDATFAVAYQVDLGCDWNKRNLKCVAFLSKLNDEDFSDNKIDNAACVDYLGAVASVDGVSASAALTETGRFTIDGVRVHSPRKGINLVRLSDGRVVKVLVR